MDLYELINTTFYDVFKSNGRMVKTPQDGSLDVEAIRMFKAVAKSFSVHENFTDNKQTFCSEVVLERQRSLNLDDLSKVEWELIEKLDFKKLNAIVRARISDAIWFQTGSKKYAKLAINSYLELLDGQIEENKWKNRYLLLLTRIWNIVISSGSLKKEVFQCIKKYEENLYKSSNGQFLRFIQWENATKRIDFTLDTIQRLKDILAITKDFESKELILEILIKNVNQLEKQEFKNEYSKNILEEGEENLDPILLKYIKKALHYTKQEEYQEKLYKLYKRVYDQIGENMIEFVREMRLDDSTPYGVYRKQISKLGFKEVLLYLAQCISDEAFYSDRLNVNKKSLMDDLFGTEVLDSDNRRLYSLNPRSKENENEWQLHDFKQQAVFIGKMIIQPLLEGLSKFDSSELITLRLLINESDVVPEDRKNVVYEGFHKAIEGDQYDAIKGLTTEFEECLRNHININDGIDFEIKNGNYEFKTGNSLAKECGKYLDEREAFLVESVFSKYSLNVRNLSSHGITNSKDMESGEYYVFLAIFLNFIYLGSWFNDWE
ncbi:DUF7380 domain-containing protein [Fructobacillus fructosus]|uniref:DUF7380 domain-containing protein n=1 Tax=Fructobacillus fructosus TaxID=1631 RepID=UPI00200ABE1A|nr:hypothetical protein [Fructobacillus fructosus]MCK8638983.1 hypothetical protein [Fructobacillus fructosus]